MKYSEWNGKKKTKFLQDLYDRFQAKKKYSFGEALKIYF